VTVPFSISADLLQGTYRGHGSDGGVERMPSVTRLHSALLCAAGFGPRARQRDDGFVPCDADDAALRWLEQNPPDAVSIPALHVNRGPAIAYRDDGTLKRPKTGTAIKKKLPKSADSSVAAAGRFVWTWSETPPPPIVEALEALCPDVPYLGTTETPVRLTSSRSAPDPTHVLDLDAGLFAGSGVDLDVPVAGRVDELTVAHAAARGRAPGAKQDSIGSDERSASAVPPRNAARAARYAPVQVARGDVPWPEVLVVPLDLGAQRHPVRERDKVRWAVAAHRALIRSAGDGAPPLLTGAYPQGVARPANRIALHMIDEQESTALAVLLPRGADPGELDAALRALRAMPTFRGPGGVLARLGHAEYRSGELFWPERPPGTVRLWRTSPPAVPDTRGHDAGWTFGHAALLSLGFVWQHSTQLPAVRGRGDARYRAVVEAVHDAGAATLAVEPLRTSAVQDYVHRVNEHAVVRPYRATLTVGDLGADRTVQAIGQSRHLGGGLLVPDDRPEGSMFGGAR
jgi:CRISPR-associated protein Csb2